MRRLSRNRGRAPRGKEPGRSGPARVGGALGAPLPSARPSRPLGVSIHPALGLRLPCSRDPRLPSCFSLGAALPHPFPLSPTVWILPGCVSSLPVASASLSYCVPLCVSLVRPSVSLSTAPPLSLSAGLSSPSFSLPGSFILLSPPSPGFVSLLPPDPLSLSLPQFRSPSPLLSFSPSSSPLFSVWPPAPSSHLPASFSPWSLSLSFSLPVSFPPPPPLSLFLLPSLPPPRCSEPGLELGVGWGWWSRGPGLG